DEIRSTGATISVKDTLADAAERPAKVILATSKLTLAGDLTIEANSKALTSVKVLPKGSIFVDPQDYSESLPHFVDNFPVNVTEDEVLVGGSANLTIKTKSDGAKVEITAKPLKFNNGTSLIAATGTGSQINVDYPGSPSAQNSLIFNGGGVTFDTSNPNGDAGDINILADKVRNAADAVVSLKANADSNGKGGNITISMDRGTLALGSEAGAMSLTAGGNNGNGGTVTIMNNIHNGRVTYQNSATGPAIDVSAVGSSGDGGTVTIESDILADDDGIVAVAALAGPGEVFVARGAGSGKGGKLTLKQKIVNFAGQINAPSAANGNGGEIEIAATVSMVLGTADNPAVLTADGSGSGKGGKIKITAPSGFSVDLKNASISAKGGDNGEGGEVIVSGTAPFNVNKVINVDGGNGIGTGDFDGSISLTGILCQQWKTGFAFPSEYWNCVNPGNPSPSDKIPAQIASNLPNGIPTTIKNAQNVELYVMEDPSQFSVFFASSLDAHIAGYTFSFRNTDGLYEQPFYTTIFENTTLTRSGYVSVPDDWLKENTTHEMGHQLDVARGSESADAIFEQISADFLFLDTLGNGQPCTIGVDAGQGPFVGVVDSLTGQPFCDNGQLVNPNNYSGLTNHEIAQKSSQNLNQVLLLGEISWAEPYAHAFAFQGFSKNIPFPPGYYDPTAEGLFAKGYFTCTQSHVATLLGTNFTKVYDYPCVVPAP
ncbi:MAG TPA: hypothetical protein PKZ32_17625, partial [Candidatus Melainabacteria bacterium]|nr:hypothetical protein [Candidatus Melainabacteria bacterium]